MVDLAESIKNAEHAGKAKAMSKRVCWQMGDQQPGTYAGGPWSQSCASWRLQKHPCSI
jgi:hypothetical protein